MQIFSLIPVFFIFLYCLYRLTKDDYIFIRRNITLEQVFDVAFLVGLVGLFFSRVFYFILNPLHGKSIFLLFFSPSIGGLSLLGIIVGGVIGIYSIGRYKKMPLGRVFDFFSLAFLTCLPFGFASQILFHKKDDLLLALFDATLFLMLLLFFLKFLYPRLMSRNMKEGDLTIFFLISFSLISFISDGMRVLKGYEQLLSIQMILSVILFLLSSVFLIKQEWGRRKK